MREDDGVPDVPEIEVEDPHWKVGDGMTDRQGNPDFLIGQIAVVNKGIVAGRQFYDIAFFDTKGQARGRLHLSQEEQGMSLT